MPSVSKVLYPFVLSRNHELVYLSLTLLKKKRVLLARWKSVQNVVIGGTIAAFVQNIWSALVNLALGCRTYVTSVK